MDLAEVTIEDEATDVAATLQAGVHENADPQYVAGTVAARQPAKPVLGVRIPQLRTAVRSAARARLRAGAGRDDVARRAADLLWRGQTHEEELAACMLLRLAGAAPTAGLVAAWAAQLDNWLSVDELGGLVGAAVVAGDLDVDELRGLVAGSPWQRRLYLVSLIAPIRLGLDPSEMPQLREVLCDTAPPVRKAARWLITNVVKNRPSAREELRRLLPGPDPKPLVRLLTG